MHVLIVFKWRQLRLNVSLTSIKRAVNLLENVTNQSALLWIAEGDKPSFLRQKGYSGLGEF